MPPHADLAVVGNALGAGAGVLRDAEHALHATGNAADHATHRTADDGAQRAEHLAAGVKTFFSAAGDALRVCGPVIATSANVAAARDIFTRA